MKQEAIVSLTWPCLCQQVPLFGEVFDDVIGSIGVVRPILELTGRVQVDRFGSLGQEPAAQSWGEGGGEGAAGYIACL